MPSAIIESYLKDPSIDAAKKQNMATKLDSGEWKEADLEAKISSKYGNKYGGASPKPVSQPQKQWYENVSDAIGSGAKAVAEAGQAGVAEFGKAIGNTVNAATQAGNEIGMAMNPSLNMLPQNVKDELKNQSVLTSAGSAAQNLGNKAAENVYNVGKQSGFNRNSIASKVGGFAGNVAAQVPSIVAGGEVSGLLKTGAKGVPYLRNLGANVVGGAVSTEGGVAASEGRLATPKELATGAVIDLGTNLVGDALNYAGKRAYDKILGLSKKKQALMADKGLDLARTMADKGHIGNKQSLINKTSKDVKNLADELDDLIAKAEKGDNKAIVKLGQKMGFSADDLLNGVRKKVLDSEKNAQLFGNIKTGRNQVLKAIDEFSETVGDKTLTLGQVQNLKRKLGKSLEKYGYFAKMGDAKATATQLVNNAIRGNAQAIVENSVKGAKEINQKMRPLLEIRKQLSNEGKYSGLLTDTILGGLIGGGGLAQGKKPENVLLDTAGAILMKHGLQSDMGRSIRGAVLSKASKLMPAVSQAAKSVNTQVSKTRGKSLTKEDFAKIGAVATKRTKELLPKLIPFR